LAPNPNPQATLQLASTHLRLAALLLHTGSQISFSTAMSGICQDSPTDCYTHQNLLTQFSAKLKTEAEVFLSLLIKLISGETEPRQVRCGGAG